MVHLIMNQLAGFPASALAWAATFLLHSTLLIGAIWLLTRLLGMKAMTVQDKLWKVALTGALFSCTVQAGLGERAVTPRIFLPPLSVPGSAVDNGPMAGGADSADTLLLQRSFPAEFGRLAQGPAPPSRDGFGPASPAPLHQSIPFRWQWLLLVCWGLGAAVLTASLILQLIRLRERFRSRTEITSGPAHDIFKELNESRTTGPPVRLTASDRIPVPLAYGIRRPDVCLPRSMVRDLAPDQLRSVMAHELAHIVRRDQAWLLAARLAEGIFFFQPLVRLARRSYQETAEFICDGEAVRRTGERIPLARSLHQMARRRVSTSTAMTMPGISGKGSSLNRRIEMILNRNNTAASAGRSRWFSPLAAALILTFAFLAPGVTAGDDPPRPEEIKPAETVPAPVIPNADRSIVEPVAVPAPASVPRVTQAVEPVPVPRVMVSPEPVLPVQEVPEPAAPADEAISEAEAAALAEVERRMADEERELEQVERELAAQEKAMQEVEREMAEQETAMELAEQEMAETEREMEAEEAAMAEAEREMELMEQELATHELDLARAEQELAEKEEALTRELDTLHDEAVENEEEAGSAAGRSREEVKAREEVIRQRHREITRQHAEISRHHRDMARRQVEALRQRRAVFHSEETALRAQRRGLERALRAMDTSLADELTHEQRERLEAMKSDMEARLRLLDKRGAAERTVVASESVPRPEEIE